jgi:hypothetical protein
VLGERAFDGRLALGEAAHHAALVAQLVEILVRALQRKRALAHEAMALRAVAGSKAEHRARHHARAVHHHQSVHRAHELRVAVAPAHQLGDRQFLYRALDHAGERFVEHRAAPP